MHVFRISPERATFLILCELTTACESEYWNAKPTWRNGDYYLLTLIVSVNVAHCKTWHIYWSAHCSCRNPARSGTTPLFTTLFPTILFKMAVIKLHFSKFYPHNYTFLTVEKLLTTVIKRLGLISYLLKFKQLRFCCWKLTKHKLPRCLTALSMEPVAVWVWSCGFFLDNFKKMF